ncbi:DUF3500 domain-containing protein [Tuwongella immobilis]|uniref:DUF3500 domain-containing protein n=1 Tax=Tuwongella immobilis TaxID=692036 RepID=A0A6C2YRP1_9BACT|nr:DUF3500 domain-containing protein [Tuwongella immobilis]VIP03552.1 Hypothetical conserved protein OS=uncultured planctomycete GN=HGMM_F11G08C01 PE=4 SV=1: DUF3500 [Tuwongella immobilis]VTS04472.1 Hypothetical conserved protein OS=uncultured planctomycete GN=HGMM_F11G08C01 PE=4 SV=1: DUF3500 [Tuwongella immobilis]
MSTPSPDRREFLKWVGAASVGAPLLGAGTSIAAPTPTSTAETAVKALYDSLTDAQRAKIAFDWNHKDPNRGLLRTFVSNNWQITPFRVKSDFYTAKQQAIIHDIFKGLINPEWYSKFMKQLKDDSGGKPWGAEQSIAIFGKPGDAQFEFVLTGRHQTLRADGNTEAHVAFGGPIFYGHAAENFNEAKDHPGNVFWEQAKLANGVYQLLDDKQRKRALLPESPDESEVAFQGKSKPIAGLPVGELSGDVKKAMQKVLAALIEPFRAEDRDEAMAALTKQGGLDATRLSFFADEDIGDDQVWDNWRLEGPSFVWYYRGSPHVHVWVNVADDDSVKLNARG